MKVKSENEVGQSGPTLSNPMDCSPPGASVDGIFQARMLEWGAIAFSVAQQPFNRPIIGEKVTMSSFNDDSLQVQLQ